MAETVRDHPRYKSDAVNLIARLADFGATSDGGVHRLAASRADKAVRDFLCEWFEANGFDTRIDAVGNIFGVLRLDDSADQEAFFSGSHLDTQPNGGKFDGAVGVAFSCIAALAVKDLIARGACDSAFRTFVVTCWTSEEGARFQPSLLGSSVFTGLLPLKDALEARDIDAIRLEDALRDIDYLGSDDIALPDRYFEAHIEQGRELETTGAPIGIVSSCWGARKLTLRVTGCADHTGPTPMEARRDALLAASMLITHVREISDTAERPLHSSVGRIEVTPNSPNTVAEVVDIFIEFRAADCESLDAAEAQLDAATPVVCNDTGCTIMPIRREIRDVVAFDGPAIEAVIERLDQAEIRHIPLTTIAGHDAVALQSICPSTLVFIPSRGGVTHSPEEFTSDHDLEEGFEATLEAITAIISKSAPGGLHA